MSTLPNTTLCAIVRDEMMNPAGGIVRFVESHVPYVEQAVIVDTGSVDGTAKELEKLKKRFGNLSVYRTTFENFAQARNVSLNKVETPMILVLDADELILKEDFTRLRRFMLSHKNQCANFTLLNVFPEGDLYKGIIHNPRLFPESIRPYYDVPLGRKGEYLFSGENWEGGNEIENSVFHRNPQQRGIKTAPTPIYHFKSSPKGEKIKFEQFYRELSTLFPQPATLRDFSQWKAFNPRRDEYA